eukprot:TRINITY_DN27940_c0_g1_i1.p1 TRINITY_DN27940_c0_g1~~TRINITY_DN27940_c0_g1_i1.p1  ORF type:complete len:282 (+),score=64.17 TRINITY_DN27940_c0_g1_i1:89-934(+)
MTFRISLNSRRKLRIIELCVAILGLRYLTLSFIGGTPGSQRVSNLRRTVLQAEGEKKEDEGGFNLPKFMTVEQNIELSPEEYKSALEMEMLAQRKKYYIGGEIKQTKLVVPWKPVDEKQVEKDARKTLRKNGILDPSGDFSEDEQDSDVAVTLIGNQDVRLNWQGGIPGQKVGYIVERKPANQVNYKEIATYDDMQNPQLLAREYTGHEYSYMDQLLKPGKYTYRVLVRLRDGTVNVVDQQDVVLKDQGGLDFWSALGWLSLFLGTAMLSGTFLDPVPTME